MQHVTTCTCTIQVIPKDYVTTRALEQAISKNILFKHLEEDEKQ